MARHIEGVHERRGRQKAGKGRGGDVPSRIGKPGDGKEEERDVDEMLATVDEMLTTVEEEENAVGSAREEEEIPETPEVKEIWRLWRQSADCKVQGAKCKLCNYTGTDDEMTGHIVSTHVTPTKETVSNLT